MIVNRIYALLACFIMSVAVVVLMYVRTRVVDNDTNGFVRRLPSHKLFGIISKDVKYNSWCLLGENEKTVFLSNSVAPEKILSVDSDLKDTCVLNLSGFNKIQLYKGFVISMDSSFLWLFDGIKPVILKGNLSNLHLKQKIKSCNFTASVALSENSFALRYIDRNGENILAKQSIGFDSLKNTKLLKKQVDGIFCTDGEMVKVFSTSKMIYVYYYRNQFLCIDSNLNLLYQGKTIDTISRAQIKVAKITSTGETIMAAPPLFVNKRACANSKYLFVQSALRANNETEYMIKDVSMIDVYAISDGKYQFSFYLPDFRGFKVRDFKVYDQSLYALYDHYLYKYRLNF